MQQTVSRLALQLHINKFDTTDMIDNLPSIVTIITTLDDNGGMGMHNNIKINGLRVHLEMLGEEIE